MKTKSRKCIVILGMHRSGTSALAGVLHTLGLHAGNKLLPANDFNARGYFECADIVAAHDELLDSLGSSWDDARPLPEGWQYSSALQEAKARLLSIFNAEFGNTEVSVLKDPRICRLLPLWLDVFDELGVMPFFIITARMPDQVLASLARRDAMPANKASLLYLAYLLDAERYTRSYRRTVCEFSTLLNDWSSILQKINSAFDSVLPISFIDNPEAVNAFLSVELTHSDSQDTSPDQLAEGPSGMAHRLYGLLAADQSGISAPQMLQLTSEFNSYLQMLEPWLSQSAYAASLERELVKPGLLAEKIIGISAVSALYWVSREEPSFSEERTLRVSVDFGLKVQVIRFIFNRKVDNLTGLRLDIINLPAFCLLHGLRLENPVGVTAWEWETGSAAFSSQSPDMHLLPEMPGEACQVVFSSGSDPYAYLNLPTDLLATVSEGWSLIVEATFQLPHVGLPSVLRGYTQQLSLLNEVCHKQSELAQTLVQARDKESAQTAEIATLQLQHKRYRDEILRAEAQLGLLKDLMLGGGELEKW